MGKKKNSYNRKRSGVLFIYKRTLILVGSILFLLTGIAALTSAGPAYRLSSQAITDWTRQLDSSIYLHILGNENKIFESVRPEEAPSIQLSAVLMQMLTTIKPDDPRTLLGSEIPGFSLYENQIVIAGEGTNYTNLPIESAQPDHVIEEEPTQEKEEETPSEENQNPPDDSQEQKDEEPAPSTGEKDVVFIYHTHNQESYLPSLDADQKDSAYNKNSNVTDAGEAMAKRLEELGIGTIADQTDIGAILNENGMAYHQSYDASRGVVEAAVAEHKDVSFVFDIHRDSLKRKDTTKEIEGDIYAKVVFVVGAENKEYEKNLKLATDLHKKIEAKYPGLSRGVITKQGAGVDGIYNQDVSDKAALLEIGGAENTLDEATRTAELFAEIFAEYYWEAEKVQGGQAE
ncbi:stage II sporulation protein P [Terribacillus saccharophilus]|uniref:Stage II sporulation protein P n=1 Tax=Terribacillus saccharophilus TaxID=361277 RepID=A0AAX2EAF2_9BACI|nr:stage II sporulation protein P [Terribacillus saccharophilus]MEC0290627.1 stage II sporulation protein P [Terribacillus saccharophilus]SEM54902.1 stage II sporulation protein P [Terribacillus saccharophilus]